MSVGDHAAGPLDGVEHAGAEAEAFGFASPQPLWAPLTGERPRALGRLLAFVAAVGLGSGLAVWMLVETAVSVVRATF